MSIFFKLEGKIAVPASSKELLHWLSGDPNRSVRSDKFELSGVITVVVSTSFLMGVNHRFLDDGEPILFETMVFGGTMDLTQRRYSTWEQAEVGHQEVIDQLLKEMPNLTLVIPEPEPLRLTRYERILRDVRET